MKVFLAGPIDYWWAENWETPDHVAYMEWRDYVTKRLVEAGHLVFLPHAAIKGAWDESMQVINDVALSVCDVFIYLTPPGVPAHGTEAERKQAEARGMRVLHVPPHDYNVLDEIAVPLDDPYGDVQRKSYSKPVCSHTRSTRVRRMIGRKIYEMQRCIDCGSELT